MYSTAMSSKRGFLSMYIVALSCRLQCDLYRGYTDSANLEAVVSLPYEVALSRYLTLCAHTPKIGALESGSVSTRPTALLASYNPGILHSQCLELQSP